VVRHGGAPALSHYANPDPESGDGLDEIFLSGLKHEGPCAMRAVALRAGTLAPVSWTPSGFTCGAAVLADAGVGAATPGRRYTTPATATSTTAAAIQPTAVRARSGPSLHLACR
jgi:hypothetical protein